MSQTKYSFWLGLWKGVRSFIIFALAAIIVGLIGNYPDIMNLTLGAVLTIILNWLKFKTGLRI